MTGHSVNSEMSDRSGDYGDYRNAFNRTVWPVPKKPSRRTAFLPVRLASHRSRSFFFCLEQAADCRQ